MLSDERIDEMVATLMAGDIELPQWKNRSRAIVRSYLEVKPEPEISERTDLKATGEVITSDQFLLKAKIDQFFDRNHVWQKDVDVVIAQRGLMVRYKRANARTFNEESKQLAKAAADAAGRTGYGYGTHNEEVFLRHSAGPLQGFFWDVYGDDFQNFGLVIIALMNAPCPMIHARTPLTEIERQP